MASRDELRLDDALIPRIRAGDSDAFEQLIRLTYSDLLGYVNSKIHSIPDAEDILQDVFLRVWRKRSSLAVDVTIRAYLFTAVRNQLLNHLRGAKRATVATAAYAAELNSSLVLRNSAEDTELATAIQGALSQLPDRAREVWELHSFQQLTYPEIATVLGLSLNTVKSHMSRAISGLRVALKPLLALLIIVGF